MKKLISILLVAALALGLGATALASEDVGTTYAVSGVSISVDGETVDLGDLRLALDVTGDGPTRAYRLHLDKGGQSAVEFAITMLDSGLCVLHMQGPDMGHTDLAFDPVVVLASMLQSGLDEILYILEELTDGLESVNVVTLARNIIDALRAPSAPSPMQPGPATASMPSISIQGDLIGTILGCVGEPETVHTAGVDDGAGGVIPLPEDDYQVQTFSVDTETLCTIFDMLYIDGESAGLGEELRQLGFEYTATGTFMEGSQASIGHVGVTVEAEDIYASFSGGYNSLAADGGSSTAFSLNIVGGESQATADDVTLNFTVSSGAPQGETFSAASVDESGLVVLTKMDPDDALDTLGETLEALAEDFLTVLSEPFLAAMK